MHQRIDFDRDALIVQSFEHLINLAGNQFTPAPQLLGGIVPERHG